MTEKATGAKLGDIGIASPEDMSAAAATAREAQKEWAKVAGPKRGDVLRETGSIRAKARWEVQITACEFLEAAALGSQPQVVLTATLEVRRQSIARRIPVGVVGIITPWNSPTGSMARSAALAPPGNGFGHGTVSNADQFSEWQWITTRSQIPAYPF